MIRIRLGCTVFASQTQSIYGTRNKAYFEWLSLGSLVHHKVTGWSDCQLHGDLETNTTETMIR